MKALTAKANAARGLKESAQRSAACEIHSKAAVAYAKCAELFEAVGNWAEAERAWLRAAEHSEKRSWELGRRPKFDA